MSGSRELPETDIQQAPGDQDQIAEQELAALKNLGPVSARRLVTVGIRSAADLERIGAVEAFHRVREHFPDDSSVLLLYALQGALWDAHWNELPPATRHPNAVKGISQSRQAVAARGAWGNVSSKGKAISQPSVDVL